VLDVPGKVGVPRITQSRHGFFQSQVRCAAQTMEAVEKAGACSATSSASDSFPRASTVASEAPGGRFRAAGRSGWAAAP
jgi:hypothetical protein